MRLTPEEINRVVDKIFENDDIRYGNKSPEPKTENQKKHQEALRFWTAKGVEDSIEALEQCGFYLVTTVQVVL